MTNPQNALKTLLESDHEGFRYPELQGLSLPELAELFVDMAFLSSAVRCYLDEHWLQKKVVGFSLEKLNESLFANELLPIAYLKDFFSKSSLKDIRPIEEKAQKFESQVVHHVMGLSYQDQKVFLKKTLGMMAELFQIESDLQADKKLNDRHLALSLYRTFDRLDEIFHLEYSADLGMKVDPEQAERLYEGAGVGVQSGYSSVVTALQKLNLPRGARFIDLGSGYGRVGLIVGLMRPDLDFIGFEFVEHRVVISQESSRNLGLDDHVRFVSQDLSRADFRIPAAEVYYLYDPFTEETYKYVLEQLVEYGRHKEIVIVTKGNARTWLTEVAKKNEWATPVEFDSGNLCFFKTK